QCGDEYLPGRGVFPWRRLCQPGCGQHELLIPESPGLSYGEYVNRSSTAEVTHAVCWRWAVQQWQITLTGALSMWGTLPLLQRCTCAPEGVFMPRTIQAPRGTHLTCKNWQIEAAYRMLQNNLDPQVAFDPDNLIVYGGRGRAARNWAA